MIVTAFKLLSDKSTYEWNERTLWGDLSIEIDGCYFPCEEWSDIISSVIDMWLFNLENILKADLYGEGSFYFMDGSFFFNATCKGIDNKMEIWLFENDKMTNTIPYRVTFADLISAILKFVEQLAADKQLAKVDEIKNLEKRSKRIKRLMYFKRIQVV